MATANLFDVNDVSLNERHILLVDDNEIDLIWLESLAESINGEHNYIVYKARDAVDAVKIYTQNPIECAIVDYNMPGNNGLQLVKTLHGLLSHVSLREPLPVVIVSENEDSKILEYVHDSAAICFIAKKDLRSADDLQLIIDCMLKPSEGDKAFLCGG